MRPRLEAQGPRQRGPRLRPRVRLQARHGRHAEEPHVRLAVWRPDVTPRPDGNDKDARRGVGRHHVAQARGQGDALEGPARGQGRRGQGGRRVQGAGGGEAQGLIPRDAGGSRLGRLGHGFRRRRRVHVRQRGFVQGYPHGQLRHGERPGGVHPRQRTRRTPEPVQEPLPGGARLPPGVSVADDGQAVPVADGGSVLVAEGVHHVRPAGRYFISQMGVRLSRVRHQAERLLQRQG
mmetsp:Transcript_4094/g.16775  ORF Transcript_4094/g.16775 Transcript_4094/m.16775 type:complete len:235 (-) Transcript_4094:2020-2724(-)